MSEMTERERFERVLNRQSVDRLPACESFWGDTSTRWIADGALTDGEDLVEHFGLSMRGGGWLNTMADLDFEHIRVAEDEDTVTWKDGNGATLRRHKKHSSTPEHIDFDVKDREGWEELVKPHLTKLDRRRIPFDGYRAAKERAERNGEFFCWQYIAPFEQMHPVCGHEYMLMGMAEDPEWVCDMVRTFVEFTIMHAETLFAECGQPDGIWFFEDMGFKNKPFMSPAMYEEIVQPGHKRLFDWAHAMGKKVIVHSCGFVEPLVPGLIEAGMDCLQAMEVKAGMDLPHLARRFGDRIAFCGGVDIREIASNDRARIDAELDRTVRAVLEEGHHFILHSDHSIPPDVDHDTYAYFLEQGRSLPSRVSV